MRTELSFLDILGAARRWWWLIAAGLLLASAVAYLATTELVTPMYRARLTLLVEGDPASGANDYNDILAAERRTSTYSHLALSRRVLDETIQRLGLPLTADQLAQQTAVSVLPNSQILAVSVSDPNPERAAEIANTLGAVFIEQNTQRQATRIGTSRDEVQQSINATKERIADTSQRIAELQQQPNAAEPTVQSQLSTLRAELSDAQSTYAGLLETQQRMELASTSGSTSISVVDDAMAPDQPYKPRALFSTGVGGLVGLLLASGLVLLLAYADNTVKDAEAVRRLTGQPTLGLIPSFPAEAGLEPIERPRSTASESYHALQTNLRFTLFEERGRALVVTSVRPGEGKTTTLVNLAAVLAESGTPVIVIDADLRKPRVHRHFQIKNNQAGLTNLLIDQGAGDWRSCLRETTVPGLRVLPSGPLPPNPAQLLNAARLREILSEMTAERNLVLIDTPPLAVSDPLILAGIVDGVVLVCQQGQLRLHELQQAAEQIERTSKPLLGVVLNRAARSERHYHGYYDDTDLPATASAAEPGDQPRQRFGRWLRRPGPESSARLSDS